MSKTTPQLPSTSLLVDLLNVEQRKLAYAVFGLVGIIIAAMTTVVIVIYSSGDRDIPLWIIAVNAVYALVAPFFTALANANAVPTGNEIVTEEGE